MLNHHQIEQGSPAWFALKAGRISASTVHKLICARNRLKKGELLSKGAKKYVRDIVMNGLIPIEKQKESINTIAMQNGTEKEPLARRSFEWLHDCKVTETGFFTFSDWLGCSLDGIVQETANRYGILEIKCPESAGIHGGYCTVRSWEDIKALSPLLFWQMQLGLFITGLHRAWFVSYFPDLIGTKANHLALFSICLERNDKYISELCDSLRRGYLYRLEFMKTLNL